MDKKLRERLKKLSNYQNQSRHGGETKDICFNATQLFKFIDDNFVSKDRIREEVERLDLQIKEWKEAGFGISSPTIEKKILNSLLEDN